MQTPGTRPGNGRLTVQTPYISPGPSIFLPGRRFGAAMPQMVAALPHWPRLCSRPSRSWSRLDCTTSTAKVSSSRCISLAFCSCVLGYMQEFWQSIFLVSSLCNVRRDVNRCALLVVRPSWKTFSCGLFSF